MAGEVLERLIRPTVLAPWLVDRLPGSGEFEFERISTGHSNEVVAIRRSGLSWVLRRPPLGPLLPSANDMFREYRVLSALHRCDVRAPAPIALCEDIDLIGVPFYIMEHVSGTVVRDDIPDGLAGADSRALASQEVVDALAELRRVPSHLLQHVSRRDPHAYLPRQLQVWRRQWERASGTQVISADGDLPEADLVNHVAMRLGELIPSVSGGPVGLVHGDYKLDNVVFDLADAPHLVAVLDWEMATVGDPLADLAWLLIYWTGTDALTACSGFASHDQMLAMYEKASGCPLPDMSFYTAFALFKRGIILGGLHMRYLRRLSEDPVHRAAGEKSRELLEQAASRL